MSSCEASLADTCAQSSSASHELVARAQRGDERAFAELYAGHVDAVYGLCLRMTANVALAEDCTQQTFVNGWRKLEQFRGDALLATWLHRIAVNTVLSTRRKSQLQNVSEEVLEQQALQASNQWTVHQHADVELEQAIARLSQRLREVFVLRAVYGYGHAETAVMLNLAPGTVKAHYHSARMQLRAILGVADD